MASTGINEGKVSAIYDGATLIAYQTSSSLNISTDMREITNKQSGFWKEFLPVRSEWGGSGEFLFAEDAAYGFVELFDKAIAGTVFQYKYQSASTGDVSFEGDAYLENLERTSPDGESETYTASWKGAGALAKGTV